MKSFAVNALLLLACVAPMLQAGGTIKTVYIVPSSHYDRGFIVPPDEVPAMAAKHIDEVIDAAAKDPDFRWTIESTWQVLSFIEASRGFGEIFPGHPERIETLMQLIRSGHIDLALNWGSMHAEFMGDEELNRLVYDFASLRRTYSIDSQLAVLNDVPGQPFGVASVLAGSGARYLLVGANQFIGGGTSLSPGKLPFYWEGPDGKRVLTWVSQSPRGGYTEAITDYFLDPFTNDPYLKTSGWKIFNPKLPEKTPLETMQTGMDALLKRFNDADYQYDSVMVMHVHDFLHPSTVAGLEKAVRLWNGAHKTPELRIATASEFFKHMEEKYAARIPTVRGEWSGLWSESKTGSPQISALARRAQDEVPAAETLWSALAMGADVGWPAGDFYGLYHLLFNYDEHSGAGNVGWPGLNERKALEQQNAQYVRDMQDAATGARQLFTAGITAIASSRRDEPPRASAEIRTWPLVVWNSLSWVRTDSVIAPSPDKSGHIVAVRDLRTHRPIPFDFDENSNAVFIAHNVPSVGYAAFEVDVAPGTKVAQQINGDFNTRSIANKRFRVALRSDGNIESIVDSQTNRELVNRKSTTPFNFLLRNAGDQPVSLPIPFEANITQRPGRVFSEFLVMRVGSGFPVTKIRLYEDLDRVEIHDEIDAGALPAGATRSGFDAYLFCFPFALDPATLTVHPEEQFGFASLPGDYLPGARRDAVTSRHLIALSDANSSVLLAHRQAFHFIFPGYVRTERTSQPQPFPAMFTGKWPLPEATLYSRAFRHSTQGDMRYTGVTTFPTVEPGLGDRYEFDYAISAAQGPFDAPSAMRFGAAFDSPLRPVYIPFNAASEHSFFAVDQTNVRIDTVKQAEAGPTAGITPTNLENAVEHRQYVIRLQEVAGRNTPHARVTLPRRVRKAEVVNLTEDRVIRTVPASTFLDVALTPYETLTIRFEVEAPH